MTVPPARILLTGASGFVGRHLTALLRAAYPGTTLMTPEFDIRNASAVAATIQDVSPQVCIHLAAVSTVAAAAHDEDNAWQVNLHGTLHLARAIVHHAPDCFTVMLFASSSDAYGRLVPRRVASDRGHGIGADE